MSIKIMTWVWENSPYEGSALLIHLRLADHANDDGFCYPSQKGLASAARCTDRYVRTILKQMVADGYVEVVSVSNGRTNNSYQLRNPTSTGTQFQRNPSSGVQRNHSSGDGGTSLPENHHVTVIETKRPPRCPGCQQRHSAKTGCFA